MLDAEKKQLERVEKLEAEINAYDARLQEIIDTGMVEHPTEYDLLQTKRRIAYEELQVERKPQEERRQSRKEKIRELYKSGARRI